MRALPVVLAVLGSTMVAGSAAAGPPAFAPNGGFVDLDVRAFPPKVSHPGKPVATKLEYDVLSGNRSKAPDPATDIKMQYAKGFTMNAKAFPTCKIKGDEVFCPDKAQFGKGTAEAFVTFSDGSTNYVQADLEAYNGDPVDGKPSVRFFAVIKGKAAAQLQFTVSKTSQGLLLDDVTQAAPSFFTVTQFNLKTFDLHRKVKGRTVHFLTNPTSCPKAGWKFTQTSTYTYGALTATSYAPCAR